MKRKIVTLDFSAPLHIGSGNLSDSAYVIPVDTVFSALCIESGQISQLVTAVKNGQLKLSGALPYIDSHYYIPKPIMHIEQKSDDYKLFKEVSYIPVDEICNFVKGETDPQIEIDSFVLGEEDVRTQVCVGGDPYQVGIYSFHPGSGLYIIVEYTEDAIMDMVENIFERLQYSGIGGKRSSGFGRFSFEVQECFAFPKGDRKLLLNSAMATEEELAIALEGAHYLLQKRSGFIHQSRYKKRDFYTFRPGSVFTNTFAGDVFDVGNDEHPAYRYAVPMFMGV